MALTIGPHVSLASVSMVLVAIAGTLAVTSVGHAPAPAGMVRFHVPADHPEEWFVDATGAQRLTVYAVPGEGAAAVVDVDVEGLPPLLGRYESIGGTLRFLPRFTPAPGVTYIARAPGATESRFALPVQKRVQETQARTRVIAIYPTIDRVPANLLKVYIEFSSPMRDGEAEQRLHVRDVRGRDLPRAFLHVDEELWNDAHTRLTVLFDPGRIKRGLRANLEEGAPLAEGETFRLAIDPAWRDGRGVPLGAGFERTLTVGPADRTSPEWRRWTIAAPMAGTRDALTVRFDEPLDRALLDRWLMVTDATGAPVPGRATIGLDQTSWSFMPYHTWRGDRYRVLVDPRLEDLAGNSLSSLFDADLSTQPRRDATAPIALTFTPLAPGT